MPRFLLLAALLAAAGACSSKPQPDPAALDQTLNNLIASQEAERARLVEEARQREEQRQREMDARREAYQQMNASANAQQGNAQ